MLKQNSPNHNTELIVMLTHNDRTLENAYEIFKQAAHSKAKYWGIKEKGLPLHAMQELFAYMKNCGKTTMLEVVAYTESECLNGAKMARECGCDFLIGTVFFDSVNDYCKQNSIKYMPFVGNVSGRPSVLCGNSGDMVAQAQNYLEKGAFGVDLLGYRYIGDAVLLNKTLVEQVDAPICFAGSINSYERLKEVKRTAPWAFTIGGAFFENKFGGTYTEQIDRVCDYIAMQELVNV